MKKQLTIINLIIGTIILLSFLFFSSVFYPLFNSDDGVTVLMLYNFQLPHDIYFWGQNRFGSIIPLLGQIFYKGFGLSSLWSESITHYTILILGYLSFATLLKSNFNKIIFAIVWFFPFLYFHHGLLRNVFGLQYSLLGMGIYLINRYAITEPHFLKKTIILTMLFIVFVLSIWVSDAAIVTIFIILFFLAYYSYQNKKNIKFLIFRIETIYTIVSVILGILIILYLKKTAKIDVNDTYNLQLFNSLDEFISSVASVKNVLGDIFCFNTPNLLVSIYSYCIVILLVSLLLFKVASNGKLKEDKKWIYVFIIDGTLLFFIVLISHWAFLNGVGRRYFTGVYITYWLAYLIYTNDIIKTKQKTILQLFILTTAIIGSFGTIYNFKYVYPKRLTPKSVVVKEFEQLGKIGIISEYWNSYGISFVNPKLIKATPHDKSGVRNYDLVDSVFSQPRLYLIKDMWLDSFPETLNQFGYKLIKEGNQFNIGNCWVNEYKKESINLTYNLEQLKFISELLKNDSIQNKSILKLDGQCKEYIHKHIIYGPHISLPKGHYKVQFHLKIEKTESIEDFAILDVTANNGKDILVKRNINPSDFIQHNDYEIIELEFTSNKQLSNVEFRLYNLGGVNLYFDSIRLDKKG